MQAYIIRRLLLIIPTFILVTIIVFALQRFIPGDLLDIMLGQMGEEGVVGGEELDLDSIRGMLGLDESVHVQYARWMGFAPDRDGHFSGVLQGNLGDSLWRRTPVVEDIVPRLPVTFELGLMSIIIALAVALPVGVYSAIRQDTIGDYVGRSFAILMLALPNFWLATMIMVFPAIWWGWSPSIVYIPFNEDPWGNMVQFVIPATIMGTGMSGGLMRFTRTLMLEVLRQDYIRTGWAKGLKERVVVLRHALRNTLIPLVTSLGYMIPILVGGTVIMEQIFSLPGIGRLMLTAISERDYTVVSGVNVVFAAVVLLNNLVIDLTYGYLDPRVRYE